ncbi:glycosyltransferase family protein [Paenirhodobacter enshiensis]|uniref:glycosyltransferase family protein n=1 Tax=Paenirhodobacter enshiensis TaxID=1105367 RepID=UPI0035B0E215
MTATASPRVLFYVQHLLGIGHLARASRIAQALARDGFEVTMVTGGLPVPGFPGPGVAHVALPAIAAGAEGFADLVDEAGRPIDDDFKAERRDLLLDTYRAIAPDVVLIEAFPFGRRQVRFELLPLLDAIHARPHRPLVLSSVRDILQENRKPGRNEESLALIEQHFDGVLVHGDPAFIRLEDSFPLAGRIGSRILYTGLVAPEPPEPPSERWDVVVSAGGGAVGGDLIRAALAARDRLDPALSWCLIAGPNLPEAEYSALVAAAPPQVALFRFRKDFAQLLAGAQVSVSQAGYNTACDILRAGCRAVLVPYAAGGETEQTTRAAHLPAEVVTEADLSPDTLATAIGRALERPAASLPQLDLNGAANTAKLLRRMLEGGSAA